MKLWGGRFSEAADQLFQRVNRSLDIDYRLAEQDIMGSVAWSKALLSVNVLTEAEQQRLEQALLKLLTEVLADPKVLLMAPFEDIHSWVESRLIEEVGTLGKKLHTGRSRNDQVTTDMKLWCKQYGLQFLETLIAFQTNLLLLAESNQDTIMPGYTHLQRAQPITFAHWCLAYVEMSYRDILRLQDALLRLDESPLGSGALAGTAYPIDRQQLAQWLGFKRATQNSLDAVSDRDYLIELFNVASLNMVHLSRFAEDLIFFNSNEAQFVEFSDRITSGSSLMPQKKNPDALELIRGKSGAIIGASLGLTTIFKGLPLAYNKDMQEDKALFFNAIDSWSDALQLANLVLKNIVVNRDNCRQAALKGYLNATELADYLVMKGVAFREAHHLVGECVLKALQEDKLLEDLTLAELQHFSPHIMSDVYHYLSLESCLKKRNVQGGTAKTTEAICYARQRLMSLQTSL